MGLTTLYGRRAITISDDRHEYRATSGVLMVPDHLVQRAIDNGFTRHPLPSADESPTPATVVDVASSVVSSRPTKPRRSKEAPGATISTIDLARSDEDILMQLTIEAIDEGLSEPEAETRAHERLAAVRASAVLVT